MGKTGNIIIKKVATLGEEIANSISHGLGVILGIVALVLTLVASKSGIQVAASLVFSLSIINLYLMSTLYHAFTNKKLKKLFKKFDHLSIYILIAGSNTPFLLVLMYEKSSLQMGLNIFIVQWILVAIGVTMKSIWIDRFSKFHLFMFLAMGWFALSFIGEVRGYSGGLFGLLLAGGICYTVGAIFYATNAFKYSHMIWHILVFAGTLCHFLGIQMFLLH